MAAADGDAQSTGTEAVAPAPERPAPEPTGEHPPEGPGSGPSAPPPPGGPAGWATPRAGAAPGRRGPFHSAALAWAVAGFLALAVVGLSVGLATTTSGPTRVVAPAAPERPFGPGSGGTFGFVVAGTVDNVTANSFTVTSLAGQTITVNEQASTTYYRDSVPASSGIVVKGVRVAIEGARNGDTVTAERVFVLGAGRFLPNGR